MGLFYNFLMFPPFFFLLKVVNEILFTCLIMDEGTNGNFGDLLVTSGFLTLAKDGPHFQVLRLFLLRSWTCVGIVYIQHMMWMVLRCFYF